MLGTQYSCNPKYLYNFILQKFGNKYEYYWEMKSKKDIRIIPQGKISVRHSLKSAITIMTSKYIIDNVGLNWYIPLRKNQIMISTWHGGGAFKKVGLDNLTAKTFINRIQTKKTSNQITYYLSSSQVFSENQSKSKSVPIDKFIPTGMPRNAILQKDNSYVKKLIHEKFNITDEKIILYAPTYRGYGEFKNSTSKLSFVFPNFNLLLNSLTEKFGGKWILFYRSHNFDSSIKIDLPKNAVNVTSYPDMQELLCASDILITDFSSSMWDFGLTKKPCFLYAPDLENYLEERGFYTDPYSWPFNMTISDEELNKKILNFDKTIYEKELNEYYKTMNSYECPDSCEKTLNFIGIN